VRPVPGRGFRPERREPPSQAKASFRRAGGLPAFDWPRSETGGRYYVQETQFVHIDSTAADRVRDLYVQLRLVPAALSGKGGDECTVREFLIRSGANEPRPSGSLPAGSYVFGAATTASTRRARSSACPCKFESLTTSRGAKLGASPAIPIYNSFIDFHSFCDSSPGRRREGGIQDLKAIGHRSTRRPSPSRRSNLGQGIKEGSVFRNGDIRLSFKGIGLVTGRPARRQLRFGREHLEDDRAMAGQDIVTEGGSEYLGTSISTWRPRWVRKVTLDEFVVTETRLLRRAGSGQKIQAYIVRHLLTRMVAGGYEK